MVAGDQIAGHLRSGGVSISHETICVHIWRDKTARRSAVAPRAFGMAEEPLRQVDALVRRPSGLRIATRRERSSPNAASSESRRTSSAPSSCSGITSKPTRA